jgi:hypothetical protein
MLTVVVGVDGYYAITSITVYYVFFKSSCSFHHGLLAILEFKNVNLICDFNVKK